MTDGFEGNRATSMLWLVMPLDSRLGQRSRSFIQRIRLQGNCKMRINDLSSRILAVRQANGLTQEQLATRIGVSKSAIWRMEKGEHIPGADVVTRLCDELSVSADWLLLGRGALQWTGPALAVSQAASQTASPTSAPTPALPVAPPIGRRTAFGLDPKESQFGLFVAILDLLSRETTPQTEEALATALGVPIEKVSKGCTILQRRCQIFWHPSGWLKVQEPILRAESEEDAQTILHQALHEFEHRIVPRAKRTGGGIAMTEVRIEGSSAVAAIMQALRQTLIGLDAADGAPHRIVIGVAPAD